ncbi:BREX-1 system adenine-specific DNA-methyltransferase PglX [Segatella copri]|uniref:BREX-1 system adenine-specific DNA-methyltransferase PglX n=1 Tax=Segatella copri TaxID=165179 RepID=UPI003F9BA7FA
MATNTAALKTFAQETRKKLISLISTKMDFILTQDTAELRGFESQIAKLKSAIATKGKELVVEEVAYTWFNRVMALRYMDANGYTDLKVVTPGMEQMRPEILQEAMAGNIDEDLRVKVDDNPKEAVLYRRLLVAVCNQYGTTMPFLFEHICDYTEMLLPDDLLSDQSFVTDIRNGMTDEDCQNVEVMGWLYQFYITDRKDDAEKKKSKKGGLKSDEQAAVTQLFTPHWVVRYMVENSLGRIWMTLHPESRLIDEMPYYIPTPEGQIDIIPEDIHSAQDIRFIDPCMGSGHILVYAFDLFCKMYEEEGYQTSEIPALILQNNIYGLDIDHRCYQLASFALTMKGRAYHSRYLRKIVMPNVMALQNIDRDTIEASGSWGDKSLMWQFENIDTIGSLLKITPEECAAIHVDSGLFGVWQKLLKTQAEYLSRKYHCVVTNPPYLGKGMGDVLKSFLLLEYPNGSADLMASFVERCLDYSDKDAYVAMINQQSWMFNVTYESLRKEIVNNSFISSVLHLGPRTFPEIGGEIVQNVTFVLCNAQLTSNGQYIRLTDYNDPYLKDKMAREIIQERENNYFVFNQADILDIPTAIFGYWLSSTQKEILSKSDSFDNVSSPCTGMQSGANNKFVRLWFEVSKRDIDNYKVPFNKTWCYYQMGGESIAWYDYLPTHVILWENDGTEVKSHKSSVIRNQKFYGNLGISWKRISGPDNKLKLLKEGYIFDQAADTLFPNDNKYFNYIFGFLNSKVLGVFLKLFSATHNLTSGSIGRVPIFMIDDEEINKLVDTCITIAKDYSESLESSDSFMSLKFIDSASIEELCERCKCYWNNRFMTLHDNEMLLNEKYIMIYGLGNELDSNISLDEVTILQRGEISIEDNKIVWHDDVIIKQFISYLVGCLMGRYSVDKPGLIIASQGQKVTDLDLLAHTIEIDDDGIIPVIMEEDFFADDLTQRIETAVKKLFGERNFYENMKFIKTALGMNLREYLYKNYYADHQQMYSVKGAKRPIYWIFSSQMGDKKKKGYFKALVYMHRIESDTLSKLHADYVSPYIDKVEQQLKEAEDDAVRDDLSQAQRNKANKLAAELAEKVREVKEFATILAQMSTQRLTIDLDDGVKTNYPKYYPLVEPIKGLDKEE